MAERVMNRVTCPEVSAFYAAEHARQGVRIHCNARVRALHADARSGRVRAVLTEDGGEYPADIVLVGVGVVPADELAKAAGLECENGVVTDAHCRTSDEAIYAAGDCASHLNRQYGRHLRLESVDNAFEQGNDRGAEPARHAHPARQGAVVLVRPVRSEAHHRRRRQGYDTVVLRGATRSRSFSACYLRGGELIAIDSINAPKDQMAARKLIAAHARPDPEQARRRGGAAEGCALRARALS